MLFLNVWKVSVIVWVDVGFMWLLNSGFWLWNRLFYFMLLLLLVVFVVMGRVLVVSVVVRVS